MVRSLKAQIAEVEAEIEMRKRVFPGLVSRRTMKEAEADYKIETMRAVLATLQWLERNEAKIKTLLGEGAQHEMVG